MGEVCRLLIEHGQQLGIRFGWKQDQAVVFGEQASWVLYVDLQEGQCSFHSPDRLKGPDYTGEWCGQHLSAERIIRFCDRVMEGGEPVAVDGPRITAPAEQTQMALD